MEKPTDCCSDHHTNYFASSQLHDMNKSITETKNSDLLRISSYFSISKWFTSMAKLPYFLQYLKFNRRWMPTTYLLTYLVTYLVTANKQQSENFTVLHKEIQFKLQDYKTIKIIKLPYQIHFFSFHLLFSKLVF